jgi:aminoglycoside phosphotransferase (APT) family kinase protein
MLIQEDLEAQGCRFFTPLDATSADGVARALDQFARVHADTWNLASLRQHAFLDPAAERFFSYTPADQLQKMMDGARGRALPDGLRRASRIHAAVRQLFERLGDNRPQCLVHGDAHLGNTYATDSGERGLLDWQIPQRACWAWDVAYNVATSLPVADRRREERALLRHYLERLEGFGAPAPSWDEAWSQYRESFAYGFNLWAITQRIAEPIIVEYCTRLGTAAADHETFERLGV